MMKKTNLNKWYVSRIYCPSQCYYYFSDNEGKVRVIYLRWRHEGPWTANLFYVTDQENDKWDWDSYKEIDLDRIYQDEEECELVMENAIKSVKNQFPNLEFPTDEKEVEEFPLITEDDLKF